MAGAEPGRLSSLQWAALAEGVADSVCLREVRLEGVATPAEARDELVARNGFGMHRAGRRSIRRGDMC
ncbi:hypothetical protein DIPPA_21289 [Diplonema papillatum]|nr:hypothetical protein DIPPA_21289 [Diplonema papillatum]